MGDSSPSQHSSPSPLYPFPCVLSVLVMGSQLAIHTTEKYLPLLFLVAEVLDNLTESDPSTRARPREQEHNQYISKFITMYIATSVHYSC